MTVRLNNNDALRLEFANEDLRDDAVIGRALDPWAQPLPFAPEGLRNIILREVLAPDLLPHLQHEAAHAIIAAGLAPVVLGMIGPENQETNTLAAWVSHFARSFFDSLREIGQELIE